VLLGLTLGPFLVSRATGLAQGSEDTEQTESNDGFLVQHVELIADGGNGQNGTGGKNGGLGNEGVTR